MESGIYLATLGGTALVLLAAFSSLVAFRFGAPLLLIFLGIGLATGTDGLGIHFDNAHVAYFVGSIALAVILFDSGFGTPTQLLRQAAAPALILATVGVVATAAIFGVAARYALGLDWLRALLLGSVVSSTDAAAVFFLLRAGNVAIRERVRSTLEIESGSNDPIAIFLALTLVGVIAVGGSPAPEKVLSEVAYGFILQMVLGLAIGWLGGVVIHRLVAKLSLDGGLLPIFVLGLSLLVFGLAGALGGSGFLAVYVAGIVAGNAGMRSAVNVKRFQDGVSWLAQIVMFLILGLYATPSEFGTVALPALGLGLFLIFVARPVAVWLCLWPLRFSRSETAFLSWVGLRGSVSILLALTPVLGGIEGGKALFNAAFIVVLVSLVVQGWTVGPLARRLGLIVPARIGPLDKVELELPGSAHHELLAYRVVAGSPVSRGERLPRWARPSLVVRGGRSMKYQDAGRLKADDHVYIFVSDRYPRLLDRLFASPALLDADDEEFFGAFALDPSRPAADIEAAYGPGLSEREQKLTIAELMRERIGGTPEYGDRVNLGAIDLIVRDTGESGAIVSVGVSFEPQPANRSVPVFLSLGEMRDRISAAIARRRHARPPAGPAGESADAPREA